MFNRWTAEAMMALAVAVLLWTTASSVLHGDDLGDVPPTEEAQREREEREQFRTLVAKAQLTLGAAITKAEEAAKGKAIEASYHMDEQKLYAHVELITADGRAEVAFDAMNSKLKRMEYHDSDDE